MSKKLNKKKKNAPRAAAAPKAAEPITEVRVQTDTVQEEMAQPAPVQATAEAPVKQRSLSSVGARIAKYATAAVVLLVLFWFGFTTQVKEGNCAVILRFGAVREEITDAGLYFRLPWPFESVVSYDNRLQFLEANRLETTTKDKRNIVIQSYVVWEISDPVLFHNSVGASGAVNSYLNDQVFSATNSTMGAYNLNNLVSLETEQIKLQQIQDEIFARVRDNCLANYGITITDVSIMRLTLPDANLSTVFEQMRADRDKEIAAIIAEANRASNQIVNDAERDAAEIIAGGTTEAAKIKAETEAAVADIYAKAQQANIELYRFLKNLDTMVASVNKDTILVVKADEYPFNILLDYSQSMELEGNATVIRDLNYILSHPDLSQEDREALINQITALIEAANAELPDNGTTP